MRVPRRTEDELADRGLLEDFTHIAQNHHVGLNDVFSRGRMAPVAAARKAMMALLRQRGWSYPAIGKLFGRDHSTVMGALR